MKFRAQRGSLASSMKTEVELKDRAALLDHCHRLVWPFIVFLDEDLDVALYDPNPDFRAGWSRTYVVTIAGYGVIGFTDVPPEKLE